MAERRDDLAARCDHLRRAVVCEPRGHDADGRRAAHAAGLERGARPASSSSTTSATSACAATARSASCARSQHLGRLAPGRVLLDTPVGPVQAELEADGSVTIENVASYAHAPRRRGRGARRRPRGGRRRATAGTGSSSTHLETPARRRWNTWTRWLTVTRAHHGGASRRRASPARAAPRSITSSSPGRRRGRTPTRGTSCSVPAARTTGRPCGTGTSAVMAALHARGRLAVGTALAAGEHHRQPLRRLARGAGWRAHSAHPGHARS